MTIFCKLRLADKTPVGTITLACALPESFTLPCQGKLYRILKGQVLEPEPGCHVADGLLLTVEEVREKETA